MTQRTAVPTDTLPIGSIIIGAPKVDHEVVAMYSNGRQAVVKVLPTEHQARTWAASHARIAKSLEVRLVGPTQAVVPAAAPTHARFWGLS